MAERFIIVKFYTFIQYFLVSLLVAWIWCLQQRWSYRLFSMTIDHLYFRVMERFAQKTTIMWKWHEYQMILTRPHILHSPCTFTVSTNLHSCVANSSAARVSFSISIKRRADVISVIFHCPNSVILAITEKYKLNLLYWKLLSLMISSAVIYYSSFWHYIGFHFEHFLNSHKSLGNHDKKCVISQLLKSIKFLFSL